MRAFDAAEVLSCNAAGIRLGVPGCPTLLILHGRISFSPDGELTGGTLTGPDHLPGLNGNDTMTGGAGNDTYHVNDSGDVVVGRAGSGNDSIWATISGTPPSEVERLLLTGTNNATPIGNGLSNRITGNGGNSVLDGGGQRRPDRARWGRQLPLRQRPLPSPATAVAVGREGVAPRPWMVPR